MAKKFLTQEEEEEILKAIENAEKETSGEIRIHIESKCKVDAVDRAVEVFYFMLHSKIESLQFWAILV